MGGRGSKLSPCDVDYLLQTTSFTRSQIKTWYRGFMVSELTSILNVPLMYTQGDGDVILFHIYASLVLPPSCR